MSDFIEWLKSITPGGLASVGVFGTVLVALIRQKPITQKLINEREGNLLTERAKEMRGMRKEIRELKAEQRIDRHALANLEQCLDMLLMMIELNPERAKEAAAKVRAMRESMKTERATEKAGLFTGQILGNEDDEEDDKP